MLHKMIYSLSYTDGILAIVFWVQALIASQMDQDKNFHLPPDV